MFYFVIHIFYIKTKNKKIHFIFLLFYFLYAKAYESDIYYPKKEKLCKTQGEMICLLYFYNKS